MLGALGEYVNTVKNAYHRFCEFWTLDRVGVAFVILGILSLTPILYCSFYDYANGDDLAYSWTIHRLMINGASFGAIVTALCDVVVKTYHVWQGTWSSIVLFELQPGLLGEKAYIIVPWLALLCIIGGTGYILHDLLVNRLKLQKNQGGYWCILAILLMLSIQYIPRIRGGIFWYTSVAHYIIPYAAALLCITWGMKWIDTGYKRYYAPIVILMTYLGGAGYPTIVLTAILFLFMILGTLCGFLGDNHQAQRNRRALSLFVPILLELIGFVISAAAPGNKVRGGDDFGLGAGRAVWAIVTALARTATEGFGYFLTGRLTLVGVLLIAIFAFEAYDAEQNRVNARYPFAVMILAYLISAAVRCPEAYAGVEVSGGVPDVDYFVSLLCLTASICYSMVCLKNWLHDRNYTLAVDDARWNLYVRTPIILAVMLFCAVFYRHLIGGTANYTCMTFIHSGALADYEEQMQERLAILLDDSKKDVVLPEMNEYQGPFMHMPLVRDPQAYTNSITAAYYGKNSVIAIPREEYYELCKDGEYISAEE